MDSWLDIGTYVQCFPSLKRFFIMLAFKHKLLDSGMLENLCQTFNKNVCTLNCIVSVSKFHNSWTYCLSETCCTVCKFCSEARQHVIHCRSRRFTRMPDAFYPKFAVSYWHSANQHLSIVSLQQVRFHCSFHPKSESSLPSFDLLLWISIAGRRSSTVRVRWPLSHVIRWWLCRKAESQSDGAIEALHEMWTFQSGCGNCRIVYLVSTCCQYHWTMERQLPSNWACLVDRNHFYTRSWDNWLANSSNLFTPAVWLSRCVY